MYNDVKTVVFVSFGAQQTGGKIFSCITKCNTAQMGYRFLSAI